MIKKQKSTFWKKNGYQYFGNSSVACAKVVASILFYLNMIGQTEYNLIRPFCDEKRFTTVGHFRFLFIVTPIVRVCNCSMFCCTLLYVHSSIAIILMGKSELVSLLNLSTWCLVLVKRLFLAVPQGCLWFVIVVFPDHTHLLFLNVKLNKTICLFYAFFQFPNMTSDV